MNAKEFRFCVGEVTGERSTVWKIWVNKNDIYILSRMMGSDAKISLHASGCCQFSRTLKWWVNHGEDVVQKKIDILFVGNYLKFQMAKLLMFFELSFQEVN